MKVTFERTMNGWVVTDFVEEQEDSNDRVFVFEDSESTFSSNPGAESLKKGLEEVFFEFFRDKKDGGLVVEYFPDGEDSTSETFSVYKTSVLDELASTDSKLTSKSDKDKWRY